MSDFDLVLSGRVILTDREVEAGVCAFKFSTFGTDAKRFPRIPPALLMACFAEVAKTGLAAGPICRGIVAGITRIEIVLTGRPDNAGTAPIDRRADAFVAAAALITDLDAEAQAHAAGPGHLSATVGEFTIEPGAANVVPGRVRMLIGARAEDRPATEDVLIWVDTRLTTLPPGITARSRLPSDNRPTPMDEVLARQLMVAVDLYGARHRWIVSGAGHDAAFVAKIAPSIMIFVSSRDGRSHCPEEFSTTSSIGLGAEILAEAVIEFDREEGN